MIWPDRRLSKLPFVLLLALTVALTALPACSDESSRDDTEDEEPDDELPDEVSQKVGVSGGIVKARGVTLDIPKGALDKEVTITAKRIDREVGKSGGKEAAASKQLSPLYEFGPAGTKFKQDVNVTIERTKEASDPKKVAMLFTKETNPKEFEVLPSSTKGKETSAKVRHFSQAFLAEPLEEDGGDGGDGDEDAGTGGDGDGDGAATETNVVVRARSSSGTPLNPAWAAFKDGDEPFVEIQPRAETGVYTFNVRSELYAVAFGCPEYSEGSRSVKLVYNTIQTTSLDVEIDAYGCEVEAEEEETVWVPLEVQVGQFESIRMTWHGWFGGAETIAAPTYTQQSYVAPTTPFDVMVGLGPSNDSLSFMSIARDLTVTSESSLSIDPASEGVPVTETRTATVSNLGPGGAFSSIAYSSPQAPYGLDVAVGETSYDESSHSYSFVVVPDTLARPDDLYTLTASAYESAYDRSVAVTSSSATDLTAEMPDQFQVSFSEEEAEATAPYRPLYSFTPMSGAGYYTFYLRTYWFNENPGTELNFEVSAEWLRATNNLTEEAGKFLVPDLSDLDGLAPAWFPTFEAARDREMSAGAKGEQAISSGSRRWVTTYSEYLYSQSI